MPQMFPNDLLCRSILFPKSWPNDVFDIEALLRLDSVDKNVHALSVASRYLLETVDGAHKYGCRAAVAGNKRLEEKNQRPPAPVAEAIHYLGFYDMRYGAVTDISLNYYEIQIRWRFENGEDAHFQIELHPKSGDSTERQRKAERAAARALLATCLAGPYRHICACDEAFRQDLETIEMTEFAFEQLGMI
ncbi:hypothetical protein AB6802_09500 [Mesorhizobium sp. RCC_202]|uniref:hypothetical protein n=1 Tax=Mesorhizobium sp. RCC_202 TaxID=3239222 RepID=UPI003523D731